MDAKYSSFMQFYSYYKTQCIDAKLVCLLLPYLNLEFNPNPAHHNLSSETTWCFIKKQPLFLSFIIYSNDNQFT